MNRDINGGFAACPFTGNVFVRKPPPSSFLINLPCPQATVKRDNAAINSAAVRRVISATKAAHNTKWSVKAAMLTYKPLRMRKRTSYARKYAYTYRLRIVTYSPDLPQTILPLFEDRSHRPSLTLLIRIFRSRFIVLL